MALILARKIRQYRSIVSILQQQSSKKIPSGSRPQSKRYCRRASKTMIPQHIFQQDRRCWYPSSVIIKPQKEDTATLVVIRDGFFPVQATSTS
jgi:hypothetical protein